MPFYYMGLTSLCARNVFYIYFSIMNTPKYLECLCLILVWKVKTKRFGYANDTWGILQLLKLRERRKRTSQISFVLSVSFSHQSLFTSANLCLTIHPDSLSWSIAPLSLLLSHDQITGQYVKLKRINVFIFEDFHLF